MAKRRTKAERDQEAKQRLRQRVEDGEPITEGWFDSRGPLSIMSAIEIVWHYGHVCVRREDGAGGTVRPLRKITTRGDLRNLCRMLEIELRERQGIHHQMNPSPK